MENRFFKNNNFLDKDETRNNVVQFPNITANNGNAIDDDDDEKIIIYVPKGYAAKVILEKKYESGTTIEYQDPDVNVNKVNSEIFTSDIKDELATTSICDIINLQTESNCTGNFNSIYNNMSEEDIDMRKSLMYDVLKEQIKFLIVAICFIVISLIGIIVFNRTGFYIIHPLLYIITLFMGIGWGATALASIRNNRM